MSTAAVIREAARLLADAENKRIVRLTELGSEGSVMELAGFGGSLGIHEPRRRFRIARDGSSYEDKWVSKRFVTTPPPD